VFAVLAEIIVEAVGKSCGFARTATTAATAATSTAAARTGAFLAGGGGMFPVFIRAAGSRCSDRVAGDDRRLVRRSRVGLAGLDDRLDHRRSQRCHRRLGRCIRHRFDGFGHPRLACLGLLCGLLLLRLRLRLHLRFARLRRPCGLLAACRLGLARLPLRALTVAALAAPGLALALVATAAVALTALTAFPAVAAVAAFAALRRLRRTRRRCRRRGRLADKDPPQPADDS